MATLDERVYDGDQAYLVLQNSAFQAALNDIETEIMEQWKQSPARDPEGREKLWQLLKLAGKLRANLQTRLETGKLAKLEIAHNQTLAERAKALVGMS